MFSGMDLTTIEAFAKALAGNWRTFDSFAWFGRPEDADDWAIIYTHHRDSGLLDQSNARVLAKQLESYLDENALVAESHNHWAVGYIDGYSVKVFDSDGNPMPVIKVLFDVAKRLADYPVLDEDDYSALESDATYDNVQHALGYLLQKLDLNLDVPSLADEVISWIGNETSCGLESCDDQGGYPDDDELTDALVNLGYLLEAA